MFIVPTQQIRRFAGVFGLDLGWVNFSDFSCREQNLSRSVQRDLQRRQVAVLFHRSMAIHRNMAIHGSRPAADLSYTRPAVTHFNTTPWCIDV